MKLNFRRDSANKSGKSPLQKLVDDAREFSIEQFLKSLQRGNALANGDIDYFDRKTTPEGSRGLHLVTPHNKNPAIVKFSDGSDYLDYDKLPEDHLTKKFYDAGLESGKFSFKTIYKPDGSTFRAVDVFPNYGRTAKAAPAAAPV